MNKAMANMKSTKIFNHPANPSSQSVILTAFTIKIVEKNVNIGKKIHK